MRTFKALIKIRWVLFLLVFIPIIGYLVNCKSPESPPEPEPQYRDIVEVIYTRDVSKADPSLIADPVLKQKVEFMYSLYDVSGQTYDEDEGRLGSMRTRNGSMEMIGENKFRLYLKHVLIQQEGYTTRHELRLNDWALGYGDEPDIEPKEVEIEGANFIIFHDYTGAWEAVISFAISKE